jgi:hypothetical protein
VAGDAVELVDGVPYVDLVAADERLRDASPKLFHVIGL